MGHAITPKGLQVSDQHVQTKGDKTSQAIFGSVFILQIICLFLSFLNTSLSRYKIGEWILIKHPQEETGVPENYQGHGMAPTESPVGVEKTGIVAEQIHGDLP